MGVGAGGCRGCACSRCLWLRAGDLDCLLQSLPERGRALEALVGVLCHGFEHYPLNCLRQVGLPGIRAGNHARRWLPSGQQFIQQDAHGVYVRALIDQPALHLLRAAVRVGCFAGRLRQAKLT